MKIEPIKVIKVKEWGEDRIITRKICEMDEESIEDIEFIIKKEILEEEFKNIDKDVDELIKEM